MLRLLYLKMEEARLQVNDLRILMQLSKISCLYYLFEFKSFIFVHPALLKRQGVNVKGLVKAAPPKDELQIYIDCTGNLQVLYKSSSLPLL